MSADVVGGHAVQHGVDKGAVAGVDEGGAGCAAHGRQAVFDNAMTVLYLLLLCPVLWAHFRVPYCNPYTKWLGEKKYFRTGWR